MKRGPTEELNNDSQKPNKIQKNTKITKSLTELLAEVNSGHYADFQAYLIQENIRDLNLSRGKARNLDLAHLGQALKGSSITTLNLLGNHIDPDGAAALSAGLKDTNITSLDLSFNFMGPDGAAALSAGLKGTNIVTLKLWGNNIGPDGAASLIAGLKGTNIVTLDLYDNNIGPDGAAALIAGLKDTNIVTLDLYDNNIGPDGAAALIAGLKDTNITTLQLDCNNIGADNAAALKEALKKNRWKLHYTPYCFASLQHLPQEEKDKNTISDKMHFPQTKEEEFKYSGGIFIHLGEYGLGDLQNIILSNLPTVNPCLAAQYQLAVAQAADKRPLAENNIVEEMEIDNTNRYFI